MPQPKGERHTVRLCDTHVPVRGPNGPAHYYTLKGKKYWCFGRKHKQCASRAAHKAHGHGPKADRYFCEGKGQPHQM